MTSNQNAKSAKEEEEEEEQEQERADERKNKWKRRRKWTKEGAKRETKLGCTVIAGMEGFVSGTRG